MTDNPYWTPDNPHGYSAEDLEHLDKEGLIEVMKAWFLQNYEDPAEMTPYESAEGGYIYIWGGPYNASEELFSEFGDHVSEKIIEEVVAEVESDGLYDWAPRNIGDDDIVDADEGPWPPLVVTEPLEPAPDEPTARQEVLGRFAALEAAVEALGDQPAMIGHNRPPEPLEGMPFAADDRQTIKLVIEVVRSEAETPAPDVGRLDEDASKLRDIASRLGKWLKQRLDKGADAFTAAIGVGLAAKLTGLYEALVGAWESIVNWIQLLTSAL